MTETRPPARWRRTPVTMGLIVACVLVWLVQLLVPTSTDALLLSADTGWTQPWRFVTAMFTHDPVLPF